MATRKAKTEAQSPDLLTAEKLHSGNVIAGVPGPGRWLLLHYLPTALFSLKMSAATSTVGKTLLIPTPYSFKMALLDASFRLPEIVSPEQLVKALAIANLRIGVPSSAVVTHTIVKVRQEPKDPKAGSPYISAVAYREFVHYPDQLTFAFDLASLTQQFAQAILSIAPAVQYIGKRGCFLQYLRAERKQALTKRFTAPLANLSDPLPNRVHLAWLDDFGPEASFDVLNSFSESKIKRDKHRKFVETIVPLGLMNTGPGFAEYAADNE